MHRLLLFGLVLILMGCSIPITEAGDMEKTSATGSKRLPNVSLDNLGPAPELDNTIWLNTDTPLRLSELRGKVVLLDMWTFG